MDLRGLLLRKGGKGMVEEGKEGVGRKV